MSVYDVVIIGSGHNSLIAAAYLARAGLTVGVFEGRSQIGGGTITEELTLPGFRHDTFSTGHPWLASNPVMSQDSLGLFRRGLRYVGHDPLAVITLGNGEPLTIWKSPERTAQELARHSPRDGAAWIGMVGRWRTLSAVSKAVAGTAPGNPPQVTDQALNEFKSAAGLSAWELAHRTFESEAARAAALWFAAIAVQPVERPGTGLLPISVLGEWERFGWINAIGGSSQLSEGLATVVREAGGTLRTDAPIRSIVERDGKAAGVLTDRGEFVAAKKAVISGVHFARLGELLQAPLPAPFAARTKEWRIGPSLFVVHLAVRGNQSVRTAQGSVPAVLAGRASTAGIRAQFAAVADERLPTHAESYFLSICSTVIDPSRAPAGSGVIKLVTSAPYALEGEPANWDEAKDEFAGWLLEQYAGVVDSYQPGSELARKVYSPRDIERTNPSFFRGGPQGGEMVPDQMGLNRPVPGWANYRMPLQGLYQTGSTTHPGGLVSGFPGQLCAEAVLQDLGHDTTKMTEPGPGAMPLHCEVLDTSRRA